MKKIEAWYNKFCNKAFSIDNDIETVAAFAASAAYRASIGQALYEGNKAVGFKGKDKEKEVCRAEGAAHLRDFLVAAVQQQDEEALLNMIYSAWDDLRDIYHNHGITWYKYGNAQKWVSIAIKYFIIVAVNKGTKCNGEEVNTSHALARVVFPVDRIMMDIIWKDFRVERVKPTWSKCDDKQAFIDYIEEVKQLVGDRPVLEYEIEKWEQR